MLFPYKYVSNHEIEKFQIYSNFLFLKVWSRARTPFDSSKLDHFPDLKQKYESFDYITDPKKWGYQFNFQIETIYKECQKLSKSDKKRLRLWYKLNNNIHGLFVNSQKIPITYLMLEVEFPKLSEELKKFYRRLYGNESPFILDEFGNIDTIKRKHYEAFFNLNFDGHEGLCPFCGINHVKGNDHSKLEAYDHLISKGRYAFNSINFKNLAIMCNECNSAYKHEKTILYTKGNVPVRRKAFYPYSKENWNIVFQINFNKPYNRRLKKSDIAINASCVNKTNEVASWNETFGIEERYKAKLLGQFSGQAWYDKFSNGIHNARIKYKNPALTYADWTKDLVSECEESPLVEMNFLKKPFYEECMRQLP